MKNNVTRLKPDVRPAWEPELLADWCKRIREQPGLSFILDPLVPTDAAIIISGRPKVSKKSYFVRTLALHIAAGRQFGPWAPPVKSGVLFIDKEGPSKLSEVRWSILENEYKIFRRDLDNFWYVHRDEFMLDDPKWNIRICEFIREHNVKLVVLDTLNKTHRCDENDSSEMTIVSHAMDKIRNAGASLIYLTHLRKESKKIVVVEDVDQDVRGSTVLTGHYDLHCSFRATKSQNILTGYVCGKHTAGETYRVIWHINEKIEKGPLRARVDISLIEEAEKNTSDVGKSGLAKARAAKRKAES